MIDFKPFRFLRCHSRGKDSADIQTQVWYCAFEPSIHDYCPDSPIVATCGGQSICFIDCNTGVVLSKYFSDRAADQFYSLAWTTLEINGKCTNFLAAGCMGDKVHLISRSNHQCVLIHFFQSKPSTKVSINALAFHPKDRSTLFCGTNEGTIRSCRISASSNKFSIKVTSSLNINTELFEFAYVEGSHLLLVSSDDGLYSTCWERKTPSYFRLELPANPNKQLKNVTELVDALQILPDDKVAVKCALHGCIYICDTSSIPKNTSANWKLKVINTLKWSDTDNYFMYMGFSRDANLLGCGDDKGCLWLYDLSQVSNPALPTAIFPWPELSDKWNDKKRKLNLDVYDIVIDKVAIHSSGSFLVAVTNNNLVCLWKNVGKSFKKI